MKKIVISLVLILGILTFGVPRDSHATVPNTINSYTFVGDGVSTSFSFNSNIYLATDLNVYTNVVASGTITQLTLNSKYSVTLNPVLGTVGAYTATVSLAGGSNPFGALPVGTNLIIVRNLPFTQNINISDYSSTPAATWNQAFDRGAILSQQLLNTINSRSVLQPISATSSITLPGPVANLGLCWDPTATFLTNCSSAASIAIPITTAGYVNGSALVGSATLTGLTSSTLNTGTLITTGNVGIGSPNPGSILDVQGTVRILNGNVGVGSTAPGQALDVQGTVRATAFSGPGTSLIRVSSQTVSGVSSLTISGLSPGNFYKLVFSFTQTSTSGKLGIQFNGDTGANYIAYLMYTDGSTVNYSGGGGLNSGTISFANGSSDSASADYGEFNFSTKAGNNNSVFGTSTVASQGASFSTSGVFWAAASPLSSVTVLISAGTITGTATLYQLN